MAQAADHLGVGTHVRRKTVDIDKLRVIRVGKAGSCYRPGDLALPYRAYQQFGSWHKGLPPIASSENRPRFSSPRVAAGRRGNSSVTRDD